MCEKCAISYIMKHLIFTFFLIVLGLGQEYSHAQDNSNPAQPSTPPVAEQNERPEEKSDDEKEETIEPDDELPVVATDMEKARSFDA